MREYTATLHADNARTGGRTITADTAYDAHTRISRRAMPSVADLTARTRTAARRALDTLTGN